MMILGPASISVSIFMASWLNDDPGTGFDFRLDLHWFLVGFAIG